MALKHKQYIKIHIICLAFSYLKVENKKVQNKSRPEGMKISMQTQMNNSFEEEIVIFLAYKYKGNITSDTFSPDFLSFSAIYSLLLPHITHGKPPIFPW